MAIITLTTDLGTKDHYLGSLKGAILSQFPEASIVDISHEVEPFDILQASIIIKSCYQDFPQGTIHIMGINPESNQQTRHVLIHVNGHYFIGADNGIFSLIFDSKPDVIVELDLPQQTDQLTFPTKDVFVTAACHLARGGSPEVLGPKVTDLKELSMFRAVTEEYLIRGMATYVDHYGNVLTNIHKSTFQSYAQFKSFSISLKRSDYEIHAISTAYNDVPEGEKLAIFSSSGYLEIAINKGNAHQLLGINKSDIIRIDFHVN